MIKLWCHRGRVLEAMALLLLFEWALRVVPVGRLLRWCRLPISATPPQTAPASEPKIAVALAVAVRRLGNRPACLPQALTGGVMLRRRGQRPSIAFGATRKDGALTAHAWLLAGNGIVCGGAAASQMVPFRPTQE